MLLICTRIMLVVMGFLLWSSHANACGPSTDCMIGERTYRIKMPDQVEGPVGAIIFAHGYRGSAAGLMRNKRLSATINGMGLAFVAPKSKGADWDLPNAPSQKAGREVEYMDLLRARLIKEHNIDPEKILVSGFSAGGMLVWNLACARSDQYAGFMPFAGTFWAPVPQTCATPPVNLIHVHGMADKIVPMKGRAIANTRQGDVNKALDLAVRSGQFGPWRDLPPSAELTCRERVNDAGAVLQFCAHPGGHSFKSKWLTLGWNRLIGSAAR